MQFVPNTPATQTMQGQLHVKGKASYVGKFPATALPPDWKCLQLLCLLSVSPQDKV